MFKRLTNENSILTILVREADANVTEIYCVNMWIGLCDRNNKYRYLSLREVERPIIFQALFDSRHSDHYTMIEKWVRCDLHRARDLAENTHVLSCKFMLAIKLYYMQGNLYYCYVSLSEKDYLYNVGTYRFIYIKYKYIYSCHKGW